MSSTGDAQEAHAHITSPSPVFWLLDTRTLWQGEKITDAASDALVHLPKEEADKATKFYFLKDAKMSIASSLLKRLFVARMLEPHGLRIPFCDIAFARAGDPKHGKPCWKPLPDQVPSEASSLPVLDFNVSHQAGLVALVGCSTPTLKLGVDIVCVDERASTNRAVAQDGFEAFVDMHQDVFSRADLAAIKTGSRSGGALRRASDTGERATNVTGPDTIETKLRRFFAFWALKEAYVKLCGEGLLHPWLKEVEFRRVRVPAAPSSSVGALGWGERVRRIEVWQRGVKREDVEMVLQAFQENYMIATAVSLEAHNEGEGEIQVEPVFKELDPEADVYPFATKG